MKKTLLHSLIIFLSLHLNSSADLVGYWKLDGDFTDSSGNGNDGTLFGGATLIQTQFQTRWVVVSR